MNPLDGAAAGIGADLGQELPPRRRATLTVGSLFSGYGGAELAVSSLWPEARPAWFVEFDKHPSTILARHWPGVPNYGDVTKVDWSQLERVDVLTGGYPCQPFSHAGNRKGTKDERHLFPYVADAISVLRPRLVLLENVAGHLTLGGPEVIGTLTRLGYSVRWGVVRASDAGAPHRRARLFIVATPDESGDGRGQGRPESGEWSRSAGQPAGGGAAVGDSEGGGERGGRRPGQPSHDDPTGGTGRSPDADADRSGRRELGRSVAVRTEQSAPQRPRTVAVADTEHDGRDATSVAGSVGEGEEGGRLLEP